MSVIIIHIQIQADSFVSNTNGFINFLSSVHGDTRRETQFLKAYANYTMLTPPQRAAYLVVFKISVGRDLQNSTTRQKTQLTSLLGMTSSTLHPHFLSGVYYDYAPELRDPMVQILTKLNDKI